MTNSEIFIEKYKELEEVVRSTYKLSQNDSISYFLTHMDKYKAYQEEIRYCQEVRNLLQHKRKINAYYPVEPADATIEFINSLIDKIKNRLKCRDICVPFQSLCYRGLSDKVYDVMLVMKQKKYSCIPIIEEVIGFLTAWDVLKAVAKNENA